MQPQPPAWIPPARSPTNPASIATFVSFAVFLVVLVIVLAIVLGAGAGFGGLDIFPIAVAIPFCGVFLVILVLVIANAAGGFRRPNLPPPPPVQQPMVPMGMQGPIALNCPNCGAPPEAIDRFGVATCTHCATRFLVR